MLDAWCWFAGPLFTVLINSCCVFVSKVLFWTMLDALCWFAGLWFTVLINGSCVFISKVLFWTMLDARCWFAGPLFTVLINSSCVFYIQGFVLVHVGCTVLVCWTAVHRAN